MRVDRRDFLRIGGASALFALGCEQNPQPSETRDRPAAGATAPGTAAPPTAGLEFEIMGLVLLERLGSAAAVHLVDGQALGLGEHVPRMAIPSSAIDKSVTPQPDPSHVEALGDAEFWIYDLGGTKVSAPSAATGQANLTFNESDVGTAQTPTNDEEWKSLAWVPDLRALSGATKIVNRDALTCTISINHGRVESGRPESTGQFAVWRFTNPAGQVIMRRALADRLVYTYPTNGQTARMRIGDREIVFLPNASARIEVRNLRPEGSAAPCPPPCKPNLNHFVAFFKLVDAQYTPKGELDSLNVPRGREKDVEPDYCPPGRI